MKIALEAQEAAIALDKTLGAIVSRVGITRSRLGSLVDRARALRMRGGPMAAVVQLGRDLEHEVLGITDLVQDTRRVVTLAREVNAQVERLRRGEGWVEFGPVLENHARGTVGDFIDLEAIGQERSGAESGGGMSPTATPRLPEIAWRGATLRDVSGSERPRVPGLPPEAFQPPTRSRHCGALGRLGAQ